MDERRVKRAFLGRLVWIPFLLAPLLGACVTASGGAGAVSQRINLANGAPVRIHPSEVDRYTCGSRAVLQCDHETTVATICQCVDFQVPVF